MGAIDNFIGFLKNPSEPPFVLLLISSLALLLALVALWRIRTLMRPLARIRTASENPVEILPAILRAVEDAGQKIDQVAENVNRLFGETRTFIKHVGLVRYDALEEIAGKQSYTLCLLDDRQNGILISYLTFKNSTRSHAVAVRNGQPSRELGEEETRAMREALSG
ncbi:MAG: DUF4446 family protein [Acidobacteriota bacterium]